MSLADDIFEPGELAELATSVEWSRRRLEAFRKHRFEHIRQYVGYHYSADGTRDRVPVPLMELAIDTYSQHLAARQPRVLVTTEKPELRASSLEIETKVNHRLLEMSVAEPLRAAVKDALFLQGIVKVGVAATRMGLDVDPGEEFIETVSFDDWVYDMHAREWSYCDYFGNRYEMDLDEVRENKNFDKETRETVQPSAITMYNEQGDPKARQISQSQQQAEGTRFGKKVEAWDLWLPRKNVVVTITSEAYSTLGDRSQVLGVVDWKGPRKGPFHRLDYFSVPDQVIGLSLAAILMDLHESQNVVYRKLVRQAKRQKTITGYRGSSERDARAVRDEDDGGMVQMDDPNGVKEFVYGGPNKENLAFALGNKELFYSMAGNLGMLGGLEPQSKTLGQDKLLDQGANMRINDMQASTISFAQRIVRDLAWYIIHDPSSETHLTKKVQTAFGSVDLPFKFSKDSADGDYLDYNFTIAPYSMQYKSPQDHLATLQMVMKEFIQPLAPLLQQQGIVPDMEGMLREVAHLTDFPFLDQILKFMGPQQQQGGQPGQPQGQPNGQPPAAMQPPGMPANTTRTNVRVSRPGGTPGGAGREMMANLLSGGNRQQSQAVQAVGS